MTFDEKEIERERRIAIGKRKHLDGERAQLMRDIRQIIETGTLEQLEEKLLLGKGRDTPEGRELLRRFTSLRGGSQR